jgi:hypothetical protein
MFVKILNIEKTETVKYTISHISIRVGEVILNSGAKIITEFIGEGKTLYVYDDWMTGSDYKAWGADDDYITRWVCEKYGIHQLPNI